MATLVLTAVGSAIGGAAGVAGAAIGGAVGALAGRSIDGLIFRPGTRSGPRLSDLQAQTSRYGAPIPRLHGTIRVAGTVIWATDLKENSATSGGGKGQPSVRTYSYSASFAVALSARPILGVGRIWADGNLLRGAAGDFKTPLAAFRLHKGDADQLADPLIASAVGTEQAPAYRGCAYAVMEGLELADFGNRIPSLTFEVIADGGAPGLAAMASDLAGRAADYGGEASEPTLQGFAAEGTLGDAMQALMLLHDLQWREDAGALMLTAGGGADRVLDPARAVRSIDGRAEPEPVSQRAPIESVPARLAIRHHDPARDYQIGVQTALRPGPGGRDEELDLPAVVSADEARRLADERLRTALRRRRTVQTAADWSAVDLVVGDVVTMSGEPGRWLVEACAWDDMAVRLSLRAFEGGTRPVAAAGDSGEAVLQPDVAQGPTSLAVIELPGDGAAAAATPLVFAAATGADAGWRRAALFRYDEALQVAEPLGPTAPRAVIGTAMGVLGDGAPWLLDLRGSVDVQLDNVDEALTGVEDELLAGGANLCQIGEELLQFGRAEPVGSGCYRLSRLVRGRQGTEWACPTHVAGERFVLIDSARLAPVAMLPADVGTRLSLRAIGSGDTEPAQASRLIDGRAMMPLSPVHGQAGLLTNGDLAIDWIRRSRLGAGWIDEVEAPLGEEVEAYVVTVDAGGALLRTWETNMPAALYPAGALAADLLAAGQSALNLEVRQRGDWGLSRPLRIALPDNPG